MRPQTGAVAAWTTAIALMLGACGPADERTTQPPAAPTTRGEVTATPSPTIEPTAETTAAPTPAPSVGDAWARLPDAPAALTEVGVAVHEGRLWVAGGFAADGSASPSAFALDPVEANWQEEAPLPVPVHHAALVSDGERLWLIGGFVGAGFELPTDAVWRLGEAGEWQPGPPLPEPRAAAAAVWDGRRIVLAGGVGPDGVAAEVYALATDVWEQVGALSDARQHLAATSDGAGHSWFLGGRHSSLATNVGTVDLVADDDVSTVAHLTPRSGVGAFWIAGTGACLVGGETPGGTSPLVECVDEAGEVAELAPLAVARHGLGVGVLDDGIYAVMGGEEPGLFVSAAVERLAVER